MPNLLRKGKRKNRVSDVLIFLAARNLSSKDGRMAMWQRRHQHLHTLISHYPRRLRQDAQDLAKVFMGRKALKLRALRSIPDAGLGMLKVDSYTPSGESGSPWVDQADVLRPKAEELGDGSNCASPIGSGMPLNDTQTPMRATRSMRGCTR